MRSTTSAVVVSAAIALLTARAALPCSCVELGSGEPDARLDLRVADAVFAGRVVDLQDITLPARPGWPAKSQRVVTIVVMHASQSWKGIDNGQVILFTGNGRGGPDCSFNFEIGKVYLVYAGRGTPFVPNELNASKCSHTKLTSEAARDLKQLGRPALRFNQFGESTSR